MKEKVLSYELVNAHSKLWEAVLHLNLMFENAEELGLSDASVENLNVALSALVMVNEELEAL